MAVGGTGRFLGVMARALARTSTQTTGAIAGKIQAVKTNGHAGIESNGTGGIKGTPQGTGTGKILSAIQNHQSKQ